LVDAIFTNQAAIQNSPAKAVSTTIQMTKFADDMDIDSYITTFERIATQNNWNRSIWAVRLQGQLPGKAAEAVSVIVPSECSDYDVVKSTLFRRFLITQESYRNRFRTTQKEANKSFVDYRKRLEQL
jgi:hypothetical protein